MRRRHLPRFSLIHFGHRALAFHRDLRGRARCIVAHPVNPPHLCRGRAVRRTLDGGLHPGAPLEVMRAVGQVRSRSRREIDGFILNRLSGRLLSEAFRLVEEGY